MVWIHDRLYKKWPAITLAVRHYGKAASDWTFIRFSYWKARFANHLISLYSLLIPLVSTPCLLSDSQSQMRLFLPLNPLV